MAKRQEGSTPIMQHYTSSGLDKYFSRFVMACNCRAIKLAGADACATPNTFARI